MRSASATRIDSLRGSLGAAVTPPPRWRVEPIAVDEPRALVGAGFAALEALTGDPVPGLRWYRSTRTAVVLGRGQAVALAAHATAEVEVLTRHSGGGAVLMDPDLLCLDVLLPAGHPWLEGDLGVAFDHVGEAWVTALDGLGVAGLARHRGGGTARRRGDRRERLLAAVCYATLGRGEVTAGGMKLVGLAQRRRRQGALIQCGLLRRWRPAPLLLALGADPADPEVCAAATGLDDLLAIPPEDAEVAAAVTAAIERDV